MALVESTRRWDDQFEAFRGLPTHANSNASGAWGMVCRFVSRYSCLCCTFPAAGDPARQHCHQYTHFGRKPLYLLNNVLSIVFWSNLKIRLRNKYATLRLLECGLDFVAEQRVPGSSGVEPALAQQVEQAWLVVSVQ